MTLDYVDSYYARTIAEDRPRPALDGDRETEVCVIGGGMAGLTTALGLAERGRKVVLLEARRLAGCAEGAAATDVALPVKANGFLKISYSGVDLAHLCVRVVRV